jgi:Flp pilus assembly protein TadD
MYADAERHLREALRLDSNIAAAHESLAKLLDESGKADEAAVHRESAARLKQAQDTAAGSRRGRGTR